MQELDCRGLACPNPVIKTKELIDGGAEEVAVRVDNQAASINVNNFLTSQGFEAEIRAEGSEFLITGRRTAAAGQAEAGCEIMPLPQASAETAKILVFIAADKIGKGDDELGAKLMLAYLSTLKEMGPALWRIVLVNAGVKLSIAGAESLEPLKELAEAGVSILVCGTCLTHYELMDKKEVGETTNMLDIVTSLQLADKVVSIT